MTAPQPHHSRVPDAELFAHQRSAWQDGMAQDDTLHSAAVDLMQRADRHRFGYHWSWCGAPIIRWPDDIVLIQEIVWDLKPACIIETGVARGGSLLLSASLMAMTGRTPAVLGMDLTIHPHARTAICGSPWAPAITLWEGDSASEAAQESAAAFIRQHPGAALLVLDSDHTHDHVFAELTSLAPLTTVGSVIVVADTVIQSMPADHYPDRVWGPGNNPWTAARFFLDQDDRFRPAKEYNRRGLLSEMRDGIIRRVAP